MTDRDHKDHPLPESPFLESPDAELARGNSSPSKGNFNFLEKIAYNRTRTCAGTLNLT